MKGKNLLFVLAGMAACASGTVSAEQLSRSSVVNAAGACNGSLPSYEGALRKRPTGIANEGTTGAYVGCSMAGNTQGGQAYVFEAFFVNRSESAATINCTFVDGIVAEIGVLAARYFPQSITIPAGYAGSLHWEPEEGDMFTAMPNLNCNLAASTEINLIGYSYLEEVGVL